MADIQNNTNLPEEEIDVVYLIDDLGNEVEFERLDVIEYEGIEYLYLIPLDDEENAGLMILEISSLDDETEEYISIEDEELLNTLFEIFKDKWKDEFNFED